MLVDVAVVEEQAKELSSVPSGWADLPTVVMVEIYKNLSSRKDRLNAASVCRNWRDPGFQLPLSDTLNLNMTKGARDFDKVLFLAKQFICKVKHVNFTFDVSTKECFQVVEKVLTLLENNLQLKTLKMMCSDHCLAYLQSYGTILQGEKFNQKVLIPLLKVLRGKNQLESFCFPLMQNLALLTGRSLLAAILSSRSHNSIAKLFLPSLKSSCDHEEESSALPELTKVQSFVKLQMLSIGHDYLTDDILGQLGRGNTVGGLKRLSLVAVKQNPHTSNIGWSAFVGNNPECKVRLTVYGGTGLVAHAANLIFPSIPLTHFRSFHSKDMRINFLNSVVGWNLDSLEHFELVDANCNWLDLLTQFDGEENQFLDPIVYAAWRCKKLHTIKLGLNYCGDSLVGIARLKGPSLQHLEIPKSRVVNNGLNLRKLSKEISSALGRPWRPLSNTKQLSLMKHKHRRQGPSLLETLQATRADEL